MRRARKIVIRRTMQLKLAAWLKAAHLSIIITGRPIITPCTLMENNACAHSPMRSKFGCSVAGLCGPTIVKPVYRRDGGELNYFLSASKKIPWQRETIHSLPVLKLKVRSKDHYHFSVFATCTAASIIELSYTHLLVTVQFCSYVDYKLIFILRWNASES